MTAKGDAKGRHGAATREGDARRRRGRAIRLFSVLGLLPAHLLAQTLTVGSATASPGMMARGFLDIPAGVDSGTRIAVAVARGIRPGPVVSFISGSHGTEYTSIVAMQDLIAKLDPTKMSGSVIVIPLVNVASFRGMVPHLNPVDHKSMNGQYPGDPLGTQTQRVLAALVQQVIEPADVVVDLHGGDLDEDLRPYSYWFRGGKPAQDSAGLKLVMAFGLDHVIVSDVDPSSPTAGRSASGAALVRGKTVVVAEAGRSGVVTAADRKALLDGSLNVLGALKMITRPATPVVHPTWLAGAGARVAADSAGFFYPTVARDTKVKAGQKLGYMTDDLGARTKDITSPIDGLVTFIRGVPSAWVGATLVNVAPILPSPPAWKAGK